MSEATPIGVLLVNLGTPDATSVSAVRRYLREFLMDRRVIDIPALGRWLLVNLVILPLRPKRSAEAYEKIWTADGSPLLVESRRLLTGVRAAIGKEYLVELAMRYGNPSIKNGIERLYHQGCQRIVIVPLYPQYASATTGSIYEEVMDVVKSYWSLPAIDFLGDFYDDPRFLDAFHDVAKPQLEEFKPDFVLFSYHGLPVRHLRKEEETARYCQMSQCCDQITRVNRFCYRAQCVATTRGLANRLGLANEEYSISFQSRLGRAEWIRPYTDQTIEELAKKGIKRLAVMCPAFVADCLETLEEIGLQAKEQWLSLGGEDFRLVTSLNGEAVWAEAVVSMIKNRQVIASP